MKISLDLFDLAQRTYDTGSFTGFLISGARFNLSQVDEHVKQFCLAYSNKTKREKKKKKKKKRKNEKKS